MTDNQSLALIRALHTTIYLVMTVMVVGLALLPLRWAGVLG